MNGHGEVKINIPETDGDDTPAAIETNSNTLETLGPYSYKTNLTKNKEKSIEIMHQIGTKD